MIEYYDREGNVLDRDRWISLFGDDDYKVVARTEVDDVMVSTVWLGLNHQYGDGPPLIFETLVIDGGNDGDMWRYSTEAEAIEGHERAVTLVGGE